ncbi:MAG: Holliday junction resolvase RuvX [Acidimicrobiia bacterium]|nr:Holliday junction resolvase RuvX [Acidimicrobiia bacterium]
MTGDAGRGRIPGVRALGVDLGSKRIGIAVSDLSGTIGSALTTVHRSKSRRHDHNEIARLAREEEAEVIVVGLPLSLDGSIGKAARAATTEADQLATVVGVPVEMYDERFTTVTAERGLLEAGLDARQRRAVVDKVAAAVMLQAWLDHRRGTWPDHVPGESL